MEASAEAGNQKDRDILPFKILSGGDEKVIRLFEAPYGYVKVFNSLNSQIQDGKGSQIKYRLDMKNQEIES